MHYVFLAALTVVMALTACSSTDGNTVPLMNGSVFTIAEHEQLRMPLTKKITDEYGSLLNSYDSLQVPLYRHVAGNGYDIYLGVALAMVKGQPPASVIGADTAAVLIDDRETKGLSRSLFIKKNGHFVNAVIPEKLVDPQIVIAVVGNDSVMIRGFHDRGEVIKRVVNE